MKDQKLKEEFLVLRVQGLSFEKIAGQLKVSKQTLINWSREFRYEISNIHVKSVTRMGITAVPVQVTA